MTHHWLIGCLLLLLSLSAQAQPPATPLTAGNPVTGEITPSQPRIVYAIEGARGEILRFRLSATDGTLDPVLELLDSDRVRMLYNDDGGSGNNAALENVELTYTGVYYIRATRYTGSNALRDLAGTDVSCPPFGAYVDTLVAFVREHPSLDGGPMA